MSGRRKGRNLLQRGIAAFLLLLITVFSVYTNVRGAEAFADEEVVITEEPEDSGDEISELGTVRVEGEDEKSEQVVEAMEDSGGQIFFSSDTPPDSSKVVKFSYTKKINYEGYFTRNYSVTIDGEKIPSYCVQPSVGVLNKGKHTAKLYDRPLMQKALYYSYGYPGYEEKTKAYLAGLGLKKCYQGSNGNYAFCHILLSYIYDGCKNDGDAFKGVGAGSKSKVKAFLTQVKSWPDPVDNSGVSLSESNIEAFWDSENKIQTTPYIRLNAHPDNFINVKVPEGTELKKKGENQGCSGTKEGTSVQIKGGEEFCFSAPSTVRGKYESPVMTGNKKSFHSYIIKVSGRQDQVFGIANDETVSFTVKWVDFGKLLLRKNSSEQEKTDSMAYYSLKGAEYSLVRDVNGEREVIKTVTTGDDGTAVFSDIPYGEYTVIETKAPRGFLIDPESHIVTVNSEETHITVTDNPAPVKLETAANLSDDCKSVRDNVIYNGVFPGEKYVVRGVLTDKETGKSTDIKGSSSFTAAEASGNINIDFMIEDSNLRGKSLVVFEYLYHVDSKTGEESIIASHEDINNMQQTVYLSKPADAAPETGDDSFILIFCLALLICVSAAGITVILKLGRRKNNGKKI